MMQIYTKKNSFISCDKLSYLSSIFNNLISKQIMLICIVVGIYSIVAFVYIIVTFILLVFHIY